MVMASDDQGQHGNRREFTRLRSSAECRCTLMGRESRAVLLDVSRGGLKLRFDDAELAMAAILPVPCDIIIRDDLSVMPATVMWAGGGLAGCRFHEPLSLDEVSRMMGGSFRLDVQRDPMPLAEITSAPQIHAESEAEREARMEAEMAAKIRLMVESDEADEKTPTPPS